MAILGRYNVYNILGALSIALLLGIERDVVLDKIKELKGAPGRYELVNCDKIHSNSRLFSY